MSPSEQDNLPKDTPDSASIIQIRTIRLRPFEVNPPSAEDLADLLAQRTACGWKADQIPTWVTEVRSGDRLMWFIQLDDDETSIGMISLALYEPSDMTLVNGADRAEISCLFIYPQHRRKGYGEQAILKMEQVAKGMGKKFTTMNTAAAGPNLARYGKLGYVEYQDRERRYPLQDVLAFGLTEEHCFAAFLEKKIQP